METHSEVDVSYSVVRSGVKRIGASFFPECELLGGESCVGVERVTTDWESRVESDRTGQVIGEVISDTRKIVYDGDSEGSEEI